MTNPANSLNITQPGFALFNASSGFYAPNKIISLVDDFMGTYNNRGQFSWATSNTGEFSNGTPTNPGLMELSFGGNTFLSLTDGMVSNFVVGGGYIYNNFVMDLVSLSDNVNTYTCYVGIMDISISGSSAAPGFGIYFQYTDSVNSGNWQVVCNDGSSSTVVNTSIAAATGFHNYGIVVNAAGTSVSFTIDGVVAGSAISTHIPSQGISPGICSIVSAGTYPSQLVDLFYLTNVLTTAR